MTTVLYIHGYGGKNELGSTPYKIAESLGDSYEVLMPVYDPADPAGTISGLNQIIEKTYLDDLIIVGNSLGGFFAHYLSLVRHIDTVLINPLLHPVSFLRDRVLTEDILAIYKKYEALSQILVPDAPKIILVGNQDKIVDPNENAYTLQDSTRIVTVDMGHTLTNIPVVVKLIRDLANNFTHKS